MDQVLAGQISASSAVSEVTGRLRERVAALGAPVDSRTADRLSLYHEMLKDWNQRINLTGELDDDEALDRHYLDSLAPLRDETLFAKGARVVDVGTGAGFPGLPLAIARPDLQVTLLDSLGKRVAFLDAVIERLGLPNVQAVHVRAEDGARNPALREKFDIATARAVAALPVLLEYLLPFVRIGGKAVCYKGPAAGEELEAGNRAAALLGAGTIICVPMVIPGREDWQHNLMICKKKKETVRHFPRKAGTPAKEPLG
ncbi:MAG: 16S rRNA (guanine(527)-N(7))-methyltransferase RsmG [Clostridia bacterium]|nr:16S rRNA (guanine(527)-N(7))-methyltransferase RsmG [Clostridia bacterium]